MKLKPLDVVVIVVLLLVSILSAGITLINSNKKYESMYVEITTDGKPYRTYPLNKSTNEALTINTALGKNIIEIKNQKVRILDADCKDKICIKDGYISKPGQVLVCLPHKVVVQIKGQKQLETDDLSY